MNSLTELNTHSQSELTFTDLRDAKVVFDRAASTNQILTISGVTNNDIPNGIEISEIINFSTAACTLRFSILSNASAPLVGSTLTWPSVPAGVTLTTVGQVYTFTGISKVSQWTALKNPDWTLPANYATKTQWGVEVVITYYNETTGLTEARTYYVFDPLYFFVAILNSASTITALPGFRKQAASALSAVFTFNTDAPFTRFSSTKSSVFTLAASAIKAKGLVSNVSSTVVSTVQPNAIFNPSPALTASFSTFCLLGKRRNFVAVLASIAEPNEPGGLSFLIGNGYEYPPGDPLAFLNPGPPWQFPGYLRIRNVGAVPMAVTSTLSCDALSIQAFGAAVVSSAGTMTVNAIRNVGASSSVITTASTMSINAVKTSSAGSNITTQFITTGTVSPIPFVMTINMNSNGTSAQFIPSGPKVVDMYLTNASNCMIDWGDGVTEIYSTTGWINHTYANFGTATIKISGYTESLTHPTYDHASSDFGWKNTNTYLTGIQSFGEIGLTHIRAIAAKANITSFNTTGFTLLPPRLPTTVTDISNAFYNASCANAVFAPIVNWNTSNVEYMVQTFAASVTFNQNINAWNTSNVTDMSAMFRTALAFNQPLNSWDVSNVEYMIGVFGASCPFNQSLNSWNVENVKSFALMFAQGVFNQPLNNWNVSSVDLTSASTKCSTLPADGSTTSMKGMFASNAVYDQDISMWEVTHIPTKPTDFDVNTSAGWTTGEKPLWGV